MRIVENEYNKYEKNGKGKKKGEMTTQLSDEENNKLVAVKMELDRIWLMFKSKEWPSPFTPTADLSHAYGVKTRKVQGCVMVHLRNNCSSNRKTRSDAGKTIFNSQEMRRKMVRTTYNANATTFSFLERLSIIEEIDNCKYGQQGKILQKWGVSSGAFHDWKAKREFFKRQAAKNEGGIKVDHLWRVKEVISEFLTTNNQSNVTWATVQARALMARDHLLQKHGQSQSPFLVDEEHRALSSFKANTKWCLARKKDANVTRGPNTKPTQPPTITINGNPQPCSTLHYGPDENNNATKSTGVVKVDGVNFDVPFHGFTKQSKGHEGSRPRSYPSVDILGKLNPPLIDKSIGDVVDITFKNGEQNTAFFAHKDSKCPLLKRIYKTQLCWIILSTSFLPIIGKGIT